MSCCCDCISITDRRLPCSHCKRSQWCKHRIGRCFIFSRSFRPAQQNPVPRDYPTYGQVQSRVARRHKELPAHIRKNLVLLGRIPILMAPAGKWELSVACARARGTSGAVNVGQLHQTDEGNYDTGKSQCHIYSNQQSKQLHTRLRLRGSLAGWQLQRSTPTATGSAATMLRAIVFFSLCAFFPAVNPCVVPPFGAPPLSCAVQHHLVQRQAAWQRGLSEA